MKAMENFNYFFDQEKKRDYLSFDLQEKSPTEFHLTIHSMIHECWGEANWSIQTSSSKKKGEPDDKILLCQNIQLKENSFLSQLSEKGFVRVISQALGEVFLFNLTQGLKGALFFVSQIQIDPLTPLQKGWLKDFSELFEVREVSEGIYPFYMPTNAESFQTYRNHHTLLEKSIGENR